MSGNPYDKFAGEQLILRDELAIDRTILANERTLMSYARTGLALAVGGFTFLHFPDMVTLQVFGLVLIPVGLAITTAGYVRYVKMRDSINKLRRHPKRSPERDGR